MQMFGISGLQGWYTTDPAVVEGGRELCDGDFFRLPNGLVFKKVVLFPVEYRLVGEDELPLGTVPVPAVRVDPATGQVLS